MEFFAPINSSSYRFFDCLPQASLFESGIEAASQHHFTCITATKVSHVQAYASNGMPLVCCDLERYWWSPKPGELLHRQQTWKVCAKLFPILSLYRRDIQILLRLLILFPSIQLTYEASLDRIRTLAGSSSHDSPNSLPCCYTILILETLTWRDYEEDWRNHNWGSFYSELTICGYTCPRSGWRIGARRIAEHQRVLESGLWAISFAIGIQHLLRTESVMLSPVLKLPWVVICLRDWDLSQKVKFDDRNSELDAFTSKMPQWNNGLW